MKKSQKKRKNTEVEKEIKKIFVDAPDREGGSH